jgi:hypothetical protein
MAVGLVTRVDPAALGEARTEGQIAHPMLFAGARTRGGALGARVTINLEGATLRRGELTPGIWGEGYVDRRHPHTYLHEAVAWGETSLGAARLTLAAGKGFVPFGSDDPMTRPLVKYPLNHHLAQILERAMVAGAVRTGPLTLEGAAFNGDEPQGPDDLPNLDRFGDSWAARASVSVGRGWRAAGSVARVASPEDPRGFALDQRKLHAELRYDAPEQHSPWRYALVEYGRTGEYRGERRAWTFGTVLAEGMARVASVEVAARLERTTRPDEERTNDLFRSARPLLDFAILGRSRWDVATLQLSRAWTPGRLVTVAPFVAAGYARVRPTVLPTTFVPADFYGGTRLVTLTFGARLHAGAMPTTGRYGASRGDG